MLPDIQCFDVTAILPMVISIHEACEKHGSTVLSERSSFQPAPLTWMEWKNSDGHRLGVLLVADGAHPRIRHTRYPVILEFDNFNGALTFDPNVYGWAGQPQWPPLREACILEVINTPHLQFRTTHMSHKGLMRQLAAHRRLGTHFPLRAWTEIRLPCRLDYEEPPEPGGASREVRVTNRRPWHFVRAFLRVRCGKLELVKAHWRGNPEYGVKRSRYRCVPAIPRNATSAGASA